MSKIFSNQDTNECFRFHQQEHDKLLREMQGLMHKLSTESDRGHTSVAIREFHYRITELFGTHARMFDDPFMRQPKDNEK